MSQPHFRRSSRCGSESYCVEVARTAGAVLVRDSKQTDGPVLTFDRPAWAAFIAAVKAGEISDGGSRSDG